MARCSPPMRILLALGIVIIAASHARAAQSPAPQPTRHGPRADVRRSARLKTTDLSMAAAADGVAGYDVAAACADFAPWLANASSPHMKVRRSAAISERLRRRCARRPLLTLLLTLLCLLSR